MAADYDAVMVLGGGLTPDGGLPPWVERRLEGALHVYSQQPRPIPIVLLGAGTPHKRPVLDAAGYVLHESTAYARFLMARGVPAAHLLKETSSYDTVGNGYFSATMHALPAGWRRLSVVTSAFHTPRTAAIFDSVYEIAGRDFYGDGAAFSLDYHPVSDEGLFADDVEAARVAKEAAAVVAWRANVAALPDMPALHAWLFSTHLCYAVGRQHEFGIKDDLDPKLAATY